MDKIFKKLRTKSTAGRRDRTRGRDVDPPPPPVLRNVDRTRFRAERGIDLADLENTTIPTKVEIMRWEQLVAQPDSYNPEIVREFYRIADPNSFWGEAGIRIRNTTVHFRPRDILEEFGLGHLEALMNGDPLTEELGSDLTTEPPLAVVDQIREFPAQGTYFAKKELDEESNFWATWLRHSLYPKHTSYKLVLPEINILLSIHFGFNIHVGIVMIKALQATLNLSPLKYLVLPCLITRICRKAGVPEFPNDGSGRPKKVMTMQDWTEGEKNRGGRPSKKKAENSLPHDQQGEPPEPQYHHQSPPAYYQDIPIYPIEQPIYQPPGEFAAHPSDFSSPGIPEPSDNFYFGGPSAQPVERNSRKGKEKVPDDSPHDDYFNTSESMDFGDYVFDHNYDYEKRPQGVKINIGADQPDEEPEENEEPVQKEHSEEIEEQLQRSRKRRARERSAGSMDSQRGPTPPPVQNEADSRRSVYLADSQLASIMAEIQQGFDNFSFTNQEQVKFNEKRLEDQLVDMYNQNSERSANQIQNQSDYLYNQFVTQHGNLEAGFKTIDQNNGRDWGTYWAAEKEKNLIEEARQRRWEHEFFWLQQEMRRNNRHYEDRIRNLSAQLEANRNLHTTQNQNLHERVDASLEKATSQTSKKVDKVYRKQKKMWSKIKTALRIADSSSSSSPDQSEEKDTGDRTYESP